MLLQVRATNMSCMYECHETSMGGLEVFTWLVFDAGMPNMNITTSSHELFWLCIKTVQFSMLLGCLD